MFRVAGAGPRVSARQPEHRVWASANSCREGEQWEKQAELGGSQLAFKERH